MGMVKIIGGVLSLIVGVMGLIVPIMPGWPFIALGVSLLLGHAGWQRLKAGVKKHCKWICRTKVAKKRAVGSKQAAKAPVKARSKKTSAQ
jgi:uncharacterized membrane protein YbaN (DUF454 family)